jgi:hypothetical protein
VDRLKASAVEPGNVPFLFLGAGSSLKVHFWRWNSHSTQAVASALSTQRLFRLRHASHGRSGLMEELGVSPTRGVVADVGGPRWISEWPCCIFDRLVHHFVLHWPLSVKVAIYYVLLSLLMGKFDGR